MAHHVNVYSHADADAGDADPDPYTDTYQSHGNPYAMWPLFVCIARGEEGYGFVQGSPDTADTPCEVACTLRAS